MWLTLKHGRSIRGCGLLTWHIIRWLWLDSWDYEVPPLLWLRCKLDGQQLCSRHVHIILAFIPVSCYLSPYRDPNTTVSVEMSIQSGLWKITQHAALRILVIPWYWVRGYGRLRSFIGLWITGHPIKRVIPCQGVLVWSSVSALTRSCIPRLFSDCTHAYLAFWLQFTEIKRQKWILNEVLHIIRHKAVGKQCCLTAPLQI